MKYFETQFNEYIKEVERHNLHSSAKDNFKKLPDSIKELNNMIIYGPPGIGKYSQALNYIKKYSQTNMKYEKKFNILFQKKYNYNFKISDIHYEVDMSILGCNSKTLWHEIYNQIIDIVTSKPSKSMKNGIILCKNFHSINWELLDIFYKYLNIEYKNINIKFILLTQQIGFIPNEIINKCETVTYKRPTKTEYLKATQLNDLKDITTSQIVNIKNLKTLNKQLMVPEKIICNKLLKQIKDYVNLDLLELRENIYDILTYDIEFDKCLWYMLSTLYNEKLLDLNKLTHALQEINKFFKLYINNYRPIFHLEKILLVLCKSINNI